MPVKTKSLKEIEAVATAAAVEWLRKMSTPTKVSAGTDERPHVPAKPDNDSDIDSYTDKEIDPVTGKVGKPKTVRIFRRICINEHLAILVVNGLTGNNSRRPIIDLGEFLMIFF